MTSLEKYLEKLRAWKMQHAVEVVQRPGEITERNYAFAVGHQSGLKKAEDLLNEVLKEEKGV